MYVLVINSGSSSIKFSLFDEPELFLLAKGLVERIGEDEAQIQFQGFGEHKGDFVVKKPIIDHHHGLTEILNILNDPARELVGNPDEIGLIGHRVVHGGERFHAACEITPEVLEAIVECVPLAPLHNPANLIGIQTAMCVFPQAFQVAVFDTAFHQSLPEKAFMYALPYEYYQDLKIRRYGFHGTSHAFVAKEAARYLNKPLEQTNLITVHLGNGASMTAIKHGKSIDTSMGMTPLEGLVMGTRCGDIDSAILRFLCDHLGLSEEEVDQTLNNKSGLIGICGTKDVREVQRRAEQGDDKSKLALEIYAYRIKKYLGSYLAVLSRTDAIVFTAGVGENSSIIRKMSLDGLEPFGVKLDSVKNENQSPGIREIHTKDSKVDLLVIRTDEELEIARSTREIASKG